MTTSIALHRLLGNAVASNPTVAAAEEWHRRQQLLLAHAMAMHAATNG